MAFYPGYIPAPNTCRRWPYGRQPYARVRLEDGTVVDGKADVWESRGDRILFRWAEGSLRPQLWMDATELTLITRSESSWTESSDDIEWYDEQESRGGTGEE